MISSKYRFSLDVHDAQSRACLDVKRGDTNSRTLYITLTEGGRPYHISEECYAVFTATKPDGNIVFNPCVIDDGTIIYKLTPQTTAAVGILRCEIKLYGADDALITSPGFLIAVHETEYEEGDEVESEAEVTALTHLISQAAAAVYDSRETTAEGKVLIDELRDSKAELEKNLADAKTYSETATGAASEALARSTVAEGHADRAEQAYEESERMAGRASSAADRGEVAATNAEHTYAETERMATRAEQAAVRAEAAADRAEDGSNAGGNANQSGKTPIDVFLDNTDVDYAYDADTGAYYTVIRIYKQKLDGSYQYPFVYAPNGAGAGDKSTYDMAVNDGWLLAINSGVFNTTTKKPDGIVIQNGVVIQNAPTATHSECKPMTIDSSGNLSFAEYNADAVELVANGIVSAVCGFIPIIVDFEKVPETEWNSVSHYTQNTQRQIIGQWGNGDYAIITCEGRNFHNSDGWTIAEAQNVCAKHGLKFAYNLDGGGSTETMLGKKHINTIYENPTGRIVPTFIVFNGSTIPPATGENGGSGETEKTVTGISAVYSGGEVEAGTAVSDLNGIVVTATYSDGSTAIVTGYTLSGTIAEGNNTITVNYGGKTTTFNVVGTAVAAEIFYVIGAATSWYATNTSIGSVKNAKRIAAYYSVGEIACDGGTGRYPIPVPADATSVTIVCPELIAGPAFYSVKEGTTNYYTRDFDPGWGTLGGHTYTFEFEPGACPYMTVNFKNSDGTNIGEYDTSQISITFN